MCVETYQFMNIKRASCECSDIPIADRWDCIHTMSNWLMYRVFSFCLSGGFLVFDVPGGSHGVLQELHPGAGAPCDC